MTDVWSGGEKGEASSHRQLCAQAQHRGSSSHQGVALSLFLEGQMWGEEVQVLRLQRQEDPWGQCQAPS